MLAAGRCALAAGDPARAQDLLERALDLAETSEQARINFYLAQARPVSPN